jgi:ketosteroid isomerase-like protein
VDPEAVVSELFAAFAARDPERAARFVDPDCRFWPQGTATAVGRTEPYAGLDGLATFFADTAAAWDSLEVHPRDVRSAGAGVICFGVAIGRPRGSQQEQRIPVIWVFRLRGERVVFGRVVPTAAEARELADGGGTG